MSGLSTEERRVRRGDFALRVLIDGEAGRPWLTCLHALATRAELWGPQVEALAADFRLLRLDARGHGGSDAPPPPYAFDDLVADVVAVWDALDIERSSVLGLSLGGMTGIGLALDHPERVERLVAADCRADAPEGFRAMWAERLRLLETGGLEAVAEATLPTWLTPATREHRPDLVEAARAMIVGTSQQGYLGATDALCRLDYKWRLDAIRCPTLLLVGAADGPHPVEMRDMAALIPGAGFEVIEEAGHLSNREQPERFNALARAFLEPRRQGAG